MLIKTWPGQTPEEYGEEYRRVYCRHLMSDEEQQKRYEAFLQERKKEMERKEQIQEENAKHSYIYGDHPNTMNNSTATVLYIIIMLVAIIFVDRWLIWIFASIVYFRFITRYERRKKEYENRKEDK